MFLWIDLIGIQNVTELGLSLWHHNTIHCFLLKETKTTELSLWKLLLAKFSVALLISITSDMYFCVNTGVCYMAWQWVNVLNILV